MALAFVEALLLYSHFIAALGVLYANLFLLAAWLWQRRFSWRAWICSQALVGVLFAPWLWNVARHWDYVRSQMTVEYDDEVLTALELLLDDNYIVRDTSTSERRYRFRYGIMRRWWHINKG